MTRRCWGYDRLIILWEKHLIKIQLMRGTTAFWARHNTCGLLTIPKTSGRPLPHCPTKKPSRADHFSYRPLSWLPCKPVDGILRPESRKTTWPHRNQSDLLAESVFCWIPEDIPPNITQYFTIIIFCILWENTGKILFKIHYDHVI